MAEPAKPYTPKTLAARWACSAQHVRNLIRRGELTAFHLGAHQFRIRPEEVERFETCNASGTEGDGTHTGVKAAEPAASLSAQRRRQKLTA